MSNIDLDSYSDEDVWMMNSSTMTELNSRKLVRTERQTAGKQKITINGLRNALEELVVA